MGLGPVEAEAAVAHLRVGFQHHLLKGALAPAGVPFTS